MKISFELDTPTVQMYLDHYNDVNGTTHKLEDERNLFDHLKLSGKRLCVKDIMRQSFAELAQGELEMRTDDLAGFETESYFKL